MWNAKIVLVAAFLLAISIERSDGAVSFNSICSSFFQILYIHMLFFNFLNTKLSMKQFQQSLEMMRKTCLPKSGASESK